MNSTIAVFIVARIQRFSSMLMQEFVEILAATIVPNPVENSDICADWS